MAEAAEGMICGMTAVLGLPQEDLQRCCNKASVLGVVQICNDNCPGQLVIGGEKVAVDYAAELAKEAGAKRCLALKVSGPFHTSLMHPAGVALAEKFKEINFGPMKFPVLFNCLGKEKAAGSSIPALLERQVQSGVHLTDTIRRLEELGVTIAIEIGPGHAISGFVKKTVDGTIRCIAVETAEQLAGAISEIKAMRGEGE